MLRLRLRTALAAGAAAAATAGALAASAPPAGAAFDVTPLGCPVQPDPVTAFAVFGYSNPNAQTLDIPFGTDNLVLQSPNTRPGQTTVFQPGVHRLAWIAPFVPSDPRRRQVSWYLQGATAEVSPAGWCAGLDGPDAPQPPRLLRDGEALAEEAPVAPGDQLTIEAPPPGASGAGASATADVRLLVAVERCADGRCVPRVWANGTSPWADPAVVAPYAVTAADGGSRLRVRLIAVSASGWASALSVETAPVAADPVDLGAAPAAPTDGPPVPMDQPLVAGAPVAGSAVVADPGRWGGAPWTTVGGAWQRCDADGGACAPIAGADEPVYVPTAVDVGATLRWVTEARTAGLSSSIPGAPVIGIAASAPSGVVAPGTGGPGEEPPDDQAPGGDPGGQTPGGGTPGNGTPGGGDPGGPAPGGGTPGGDLGGNPPTDGPPRDGRPAADRTRPVIRSARLSSSRFRVGPRATAVAAGPRPGATVRPGAAGRAARSVGEARGTTLRLTLSERAFVRIDVRRLGRGGGRTVATITRLLGAGPARIAFSGRFARADGGALQPGRYGLRMQARDLAGNRSKVRTIGFRVLR
jgi:hypothetical protein